MLIQRKSDHLYHCALDYAQRGWHVLPAHSIRDGRCSCSNPDCPSPGQHLLASCGLDHATVDRKQISKWFKAGSLQSMAVRSGTASNLIVLEVDPTTGGLDSLKKLNRAFNQLPSTALAITRTGQRQYFFRHLGSSLRSSACPLPGIKIYGEDDYVVIPQSHCESDASSHWVASHSPQAIEPADLPGWLEDWISYQSPPLGLEVEQTDLELDLLADETDADWIHEQEMCEECEAWYRGAGALGLLDFLLAIDPQPVLQDFSENLMNWDITFCD